MRTLAGEDLNAADLVAAIRRQAASPGGHTPEPGTWTADCVGVVGAHPGAGATAVAVAASGIALFLFALSALVWWLDRVLGPAPRPASSASAATPASEVRA